MKKILRKRNKLVQMSINLNGEELKAVEFAINLIDLVIDNILQDDENEEREFVCLNYDVKYLDEILN